MWQRCTMANSRQSLHSRQPGFQRVSAGRSATHQTCTRHRSSPGAASVHRRRQSGLLRVRRPGVESYTVKCKLRRRCEEERQSAKRSAAQWGCAAHG